jgi:hypothetical protein
MVCSEVILKPASLPCGHEYCSFCLRSLRYKHRSKMFVCPMCRKEFKEATVQIDREKDIVKGLLKDGKYRIFWAKAATINNYDQNLTKSNGFFFILHKDKLLGDISWSGGTEHNSYVGEVCRNSGRVSWLINGDMQLCEDWGAVYSNTPFEEWFGRFKYLGNNRYQLVEGRYNWHSWGRNSSGTLQVDMEEIKTPEELASL